MPKGLPRWHSGKEYPSMSHKRCGFDPWAGKIPWNGNPLQYACLEDSMDRRTGGLQFTGLQRVGPDWAHTPTHTHAKTQALDSKTKCNSILCLLLPFFFFNFSIAGCSVIKLWRTLWDPIDCRTTGFPVLHYFLDFAQTHIHWVSDAIQTSHLLLSPSPIALSLSQHQGLSQWVSFSH